jgi:hypothetical protein
MLLNKKSTESLVFSISYANQKDSLKFVKENIYFIFKPLLRLYHFQNDYEYIFKNSLYELLSDVKSKNSESNKTYWYFFWFFWIIDIIKSFIFTYKEQQKCYLNKKKEIIEFAKNINDQEMQWEDIIKLHTEIFTHLKPLIKNEPIDIYTVKINDKNSQSIMRLFVFHHKKLNITLHIGIVRSLKQKLMSILGYSKSYKNLSMKAHNFAIHNLKPKRVYVVPWEYMGNVLKSNGFKKVVNWNEDHKNFVNQIVLTNNNFEALQLNIN